MIETDIDVWVRIKPSCSIDEWAVLVQAIQKVSILGVVLRSFDSLYEEPICAYVTKDEFLEWEASGKTFCIDEILRHFGDDRVVTRKNPASEIRNRLRPKEPKIIDMSHCQIYDWRGICRPSHSACE